VAEPRWLLLGHQLPTPSSNARVKTWRRLQQIGAVPARNSVYVLPNTEQCREDFEWIRSEIVALGGEATVFAADAISEGGTADIVSMFRRTREQDYRALKTEIDRLLPKSKATRQVLSSREGTATRSLRALRDRFSAIERIDFYDAPARGDAAASLEVLDQAIHGRRQAPSEIPNPLSPVGFHGRRWVTRPRPGVDRMASAWLIRRFIDSNATFAFTGHPSGADVPFDMYTGEFSHHGELCTFEVLAERFLLQQSVIAKIGQIVHDLDMKQTKYDPPEAAAVGRMVEGLRALHADDTTLLEQGISMFDALAHSFQSEDTAVRPLKATQTPQAGKPTRVDAARARIKKKERRR
jgi:hypothetical protein